MNTKYIYAVIIALIVLLGGYMLLDRTMPVGEDDNVTVITDTTGGTATTPPAPVSPTGTDSSATATLGAGDTKEFTMTSFFVMEGSQPKPQFSVKELSVKKGDKVRIKVTNTKGMHDFNIDEFNVHEETPLDQEVIIEFTADKAGVFDYYCNIPGHRANGHVGKLTVSE